MAPYLLKFFRLVDRVTADRLPELFVGEIEVEDASVIVRAAELLAILTAHVEADLVAIKVPVGIDQETLHKELEVPIIERAIFGEVEVVISQGDKYVLLM